LSLGGYGSLVRERRFALASILRIGRVRQKSCITGSGRAYCQVLVRFLQTEDGHEP